MGHLHARLVSAAAHYPQGYAWRRACDRFTLPSGFYDTDLEWVWLENVQIVSSMNPSTTLGRHELSTRFSSVVRVMFMDYTDREQLQVPHYLCSRV